MISVAATTPKLYWLSADYAPMAGNPVKEKLWRGEPAFGVAVTTPSTDVAEILASAGFDWMFIDMEHAPLDVKDVQLILQAIDGSGVTPIVRVPWNDPVAIKRVLDLGAMGVIVPWVNSEEEAARAVAACKYPPRGVRGCGPRRAARYGLETLEYLRRADDDVMVIVQIETAKALRALSDILSVDGVDATFVGPMDLSASLGHLGNPDHPEVVEAIRRIAEAHRGTKVAPGIASSPSKVAEHLRMGYRFINVDSDCGILTRGAAASLRLAREAASGLATERVP